MQSSVYLDISLIPEIIKINLTKSVLLFFVAWILFVWLPRVIFPQKYAGAGAEKYLSNILYMLAFIEIVVPLMILLHIFSFLSFLAVLLFTKLLFLRYQRKKSITSILEEYKNRLLIKIFDLLDEPKTYIKRVKSTLQSKIEYVLISSPLDLLHKLLIFLVFGSLLYYLGYRCLISMSNPLPDTAQFIEWVANLHNNILYSPNKTAGADFYGLSVFVFILQIFTNIDSIVLFNIYPLLLIAFLLFGVYFFAKRLGLSSFVALWAVMIYGFVLVGSPLNDILITPVAPILNPSIIDFWGFKLYTIPDEMVEGLSGPNFTPYLRYFSGMAYEFASAFFLINLYYLIRAIDSGGRPRPLINYTLTLMLVFIFHGGGTIDLLMPTSLLIALHALVSKKLTWRLFKRGILAVAIAAFLGNGWMLSMFIYGIPQDFGAAAPFLDRLLGTRQAAEDIAKMGAQEVTISYLVPFHLYIFLFTIFLFFIARIQKRGFYFSSFLLITLGTLFLYFSENLGFSKLVHQDRSAEYLLLGMVPLIACSLRLFLYLPIKRVFRSLSRLIFLTMSYLLFIVLILFVPHYKDSNLLLQYVDRLHYSEVSKFLYFISQKDKPLTWTAVSFVEQYPKVLGKGYFINTNDFVIRYDPLAKSLPIPSKKIYLFVEDIPHTFHESDDWFYRWRRQITQNLKAWIAVYASNHDNIRLWKKSRLLSVYLIDNSAYMEWLRKKSQSDRLRKRSR